MLYNLLVLQRLSKEEICTKYQNEIIQIKKENEELLNKEKIWEEKFTDQQRLYEHSERQELLNKNKELQEAESVIINQKEKIHILNAQQKDEIEALQKTLQSNKHALDAMKKTLDNEKAFRICADQEKTNLKEQIKCNTIKYKSLENENKKLQSDKLKLEEAQSKIKQQCNELLQKNISLENHCEKREQVFDGQTNLINKLENNITVINEKLNNYVETEEENNKLRKQIKLFSKQMETYENEREVYVQRLQNMQKEENVFKCIINDLKQAIDVKNNEINNLTENTTILNSKNLLLSSNINILQENFTNCLKLLDELFENYVKQNSKIENNKSPLKMRPLLNETFELFEHTLAEYKLFKLSSENSEKTLKDEINQKEKIILSLKDKMDNYKQEIFANEITNLNYSEIKNSTKNSNLKQTLNENIDNSKLIINVELEKNIKYLYTIKNEILPKQKMLVSECVEFMLKKIEEIEILNISKNSFIENVHIQIISLKKEIVCKNINIKELKTEVLNLRELVTAKDALCNEMDMELQNLKENLDDSSSTSISKGDNIYKMREIDESQEDRSQKLKAIAIKQKKQIADLKQSIENEIKKHSLEKSELMNKVIALAEQSKLARCLQQQYDIKCDEYDIKCTEIKELFKKCKQEENQLLEQTKLCTILKSDIEILKNDLSVAQNTIISLKEVEKSLNSRLDIFKQEKSAAEILKTDREASIKELSNNLKVSKEKIKLMESELEKLKTEKQKINIRDLELNSYEKTLDELSQKVKEEKQHSQNLEQELSNANSVIDSLHEQIKHLEHIIITEQERNKQNLHQVEVCRIGLNNAESLLNEKENNLIECQVALNQENILNTNLTSKYDELQKLYETEKENYQLQHSQLTEKIRRLQVEIKTANESISKYTEENQSLLDEFEAYKVRAHSVFQKHKQDTVFHGKVAELSEQLQEVTKTLNLSKNNLQNVSSELSNKNIEMILLQNEIDKYEKKLSYLTKTVSTKDKEIYRLSNEIENIKSLLEKEKTSLNENILSERLAHENEINRLQQEILLAKETNSNETESNIVLPVIENKLKKSTSSNHIHDDDEMFSDFASSNESVRKISKSTLMPLADLLSFDNNSVSDPISELNTSQKQLKQLTMMLNDAEKNCSRYEQQNKFLKEDIRRLQRSVDRHAEIQNMEYLKNIILKFITLSSGVEKYHLVPVINKLLKLSPDEQKQIETIAKGSLADQNSSWSSLFTWSQGT
ncbi:GRIP and coiled-coil domain-containing protein 2-like isoform X2 [Metopolophium dirhodum]|uniref:GRIP and coiled-coil domain-containing protein 2-like isoform X2 n=1 Tax=Metopolophium dirhodum TaxID=44670 RepID=UPI002990801E|nr:GRIP and coiled-coil domain-containing protein 2-like isoform X2 [Metopolophium dirhodum]